MLKPFISYIHVKDALFKDGSVVPAGMGDGNIAAILSDLHKEGYNGFLSLEPHLFNFAGLEAFSLAYESLMKIVNNLK